MTQPEIQAGIPSHNRFPALDGYRAIAAFMVLITHVAFNSGIVAWSPWGYVFARFDFGVTLFFLISGFLLFRPWSRSAMIDGHKPDTSAYAKRRFLRVVPAWFVTAVVVLAFMPGIAPTGRNWACNLTLTQIYVQQCSLNGLTHMWSVAIELTYYAALPVIAFFAGRVHRGNPNASTRAQLIVVGTTTLLALVYNVLVNFGPLRDVDGAAGWLPRYLDWFAAGMFLAICVSRLHLPDPPQWLVRFNRSAHDAGTWVVIGVAVLLLSCTPLAGGYGLERNLGWPDLMKHLLYLAAAVALLVPGVLGARENGLWGRAMTSELMVFLGTISYGVFLWHPFVLETTMYVAKIPPFNGQFILLLIPTVFGGIVLGWLSWILIERPSIRLSHRPPRRDRTSSGQVRRQRTGLRRVSARGRRRNGPDEAASATPPPAPLQTPAPPQASGRR